MYSSRRERTVSALASVGFVALIAWALILGLQVGWTPPGASPLAAVNILPVSSPSPEPEKKIVRPAETSAPKGNPSPRNLRNQATPVVAPKVPPLVVPPPVVAATRAGVGAAANTGASDRIGPGQGAGGFGDGFGGGGDGGDGEGGPSAGMTPPRQIAGRLSWSDLPEGILPWGAVAEVEVLFRVTSDGRAAACRIEQPSGFPAVDRLTCRLIEQRFRFRPATDRGRPIMSALVETHTWEHPGDR